MINASHNSNPSTNADLLRTEELADLLRTAPATVRYWRHVGYGPPGVKVGRRVLYRRSDVTGFLDALIDRDRSE